MTEPAEKRRRLAYDERGGRYPENVPPEGEEQIPPPLPLNPPPQPPPLPVVVDGGPPARLPQGAGDDQLARQQVLDLRLNLLIKFIFQHVTWY